MVRETVLTAIVAGLIAAVVFTLVQSVWVTPLILQGETYEDAAEAAESHTTATPPTSEATVTASTAAEHHHHEQGDWKPQDGWQRTLFTFAANVLMGVGYAFVLVALYLLWREPKSTLEGAAYGLAGFVVFFAAPGLGLPPELPGTAAAELAARQQWWIFTAATTAAGLILFFSQTRWWVRALALALIAAPHLVPAPHPAVEASLAPAELQSRFRTATALCNAAFWLVLGLASGVAFQKWVARRSAA